jgi:Amt family ammonium transporter
MASSVTAPLSPEYTPFALTSTPYNCSQSSNPATCGNSRTENLNSRFQPGDMAYILVASAMALVMVPGLGFLYSGLARRKSALSMIWATMASSSIVTFQWYFWGYSLAYSESATNGFIGNLRNFGLMKTLSNPSEVTPLLPDLLFAFYQVSARIRVVADVCVRVGVCVCGQAR